jgi:ABC-type nitrate/sulfonate/bicarbonate transport system substrate-binding protein
MGRRKVAALLAVFAVIAVACGEDGGSGEDGGGEESEVIRFTFAPDPAWDWVKDQGILEAMEQESGYRIIQLATWDEFATFAGGHADVISTGTYETPLLEDQGIDTVTFGLFNMNKDIIIVADPAYQTAADMPAGCKIASESVTGNTIIWASLINEVDGRELAEDSDDLGIVTADYQIIPTLVKEGEACGGIVDPTQVIPAVASGEFTVLYDGKSASQLYGEVVVPGHEGVMSNVFVGRKEWYDANPGAVAFFMEVWDCAMEQWSEHRDEIIDTYPQHFAVESPEEAQFMKDYFGNTFDWFVPSPYITQEWIDGERPVFDLVQSAGIIPEDAEFPEHAVLEDPTPSGSACPAM